VAHRVTAAVGAGFLAVALFAFHAAVAQETPVITDLSPEHATTSESFPLTLFGQSVSIRHSMALVGVPFFVKTDANGKVVTSGLVEIYEIDASGTQWTRTGSLLPPNPSSNSDSQFGWLLARSGNRLAVGTQGGATELFVLRHGQWAHTATIPPTAQGQGSNRSLVFDRDTLVIGFFDFQQLAYRAQVYRVTPSGQAHLHQTLSPLAGDTGAFGTSLALKNELLVVGSPGGEPAGVGQVYVYSPRGNHWSLDQTLQSPSGAANSGFGSGVAIAPGHRAILIGAPFEDFVGNNQSIDADGELYVFQKAHGVWGEIQETRPDNVGAFDGFGQIIAAGGGRVAVGAPLPTDVFGASFGPTFVYRWEGNMLVLDNSINDLSATSLDVWRNRIIVGEATEARLAFLNRAAVLTYPAPAHGHELDDDADGD